MLNESGDITLVWEEGQDDAMAAIIQKKMDEGCAFYIIEPRLGGLAAPARTRLKDFDDALRHRALSIPDEDFAQFAGMGNGMVVKTPSAPVKKTRRSKDSKEIAKSESVGVKARKGG
jgi:hypothetical protein